MSWANPANWTDAAIADRADRRRARNRRYRERHPASSRTRLLPFVGCDGEGAGRDGHGRQNYKLFRIGDAELWRDGARLETEDCLEFILDAPAHAILAGYFFTYDATMILRDLPAERIKRMLAGERGYTWWRGYAIDWRPKAYFRVARLDRAKLRVIPGTCRTINEVSGFFRHSFAEAIIAENVATPRELDRIIEGKARRGDDCTIDRAMRRYCALECDLLARLMEAHRANCKAAGIVPPAWRGAGQMASVLHKRHKTPRKSELPARSENVERIANAAYYGGRFELLKIGRTAGPIYEYDLNSTYAATLPLLPCPLHTLWRSIRGEAHFTRLLNSGTPYAADITFDHADAATTLMGFPVRRSGRLCWPRRGRGTYWSHELEPAIRAGATIRRFHGGIAGRGKCQCRLFDWVRDVYAERLRLGPDRAGYPLKLALAALYGKFVQRLGEAPWRDRIAGGIVTAIVRGWLLDACRHDPDAVVMLASDAIYATRPLPLDIGAGLGQWEQLERPSLFTVQPGLYWSDACVPKTRGVPRSRIIEKAAEFERVWDDYIASGGDNRIPVVSVGVPNFVGFRAAFDRNEFEAAGRWEMQTHRIGFGWGAKRSRQHYHIEGGHVVAAPIAGSYGLVSEPYDPAQLTEFERRQIDEEALPDFEPWGNNGE